jgi:WD40 repeat protein
MAGYFESCRLIVPGGPAFSLSMHQGSEQIKNFGAADKKQVYLGTHGKEVLAWDPKLQALEAGVSLTGHCGWVRALTSCGDRWLFSAACNHLHQWDMARAVPSAASSVSLEKGDITALTCDKRRLFVASADGALRSFDVDPRRGTLTPTSSRPKAHSDRITALTLDNNLLFSAAYDGSVKAWDPATLEIVAAIHGAHGGERIHCLALGPGQLLYSGGGDCLVRRWSRHVLAEAAVPLHAHSHAVNALAFGGVETLVSGDKGGEIAMWKVC